MNIFEYFYLKGNSFVSSKTLSFSIAELITSVNRRYLSSLRKDTYKNKSSALNKSRLPNRLYLSSYRVLALLQPYSLFMRFRMGLATYDEMRNFLAKLTKDHETYQIPSTLNGINCEYNRLITHAIIGVAHNIGVMLRKYTHTLFRSDNTDFVLKTFMDHPLLLGIENRLLGIQDLVKKVAKREISLEETVKELILFDPDAMLRESSGRKIKEAIVMGTLVKKFQSETKFDPNQMEPRTASMKIMADFMVQKMNLTAMLKQRMITFE